MTNTTINFWDCECDANYIHHKTELGCPLCGVEKGDMPDSRTDEVIEYGVIIIETAARTLASIVNDVAALGDSY